MSNKQYNAMNRVKQTPVIKAFEVVNFPQYPDRCLLQCFADTEQKQLIAVSPLDRNSLDELVSILIGSIKPEESRIIAP